MEKLEVPPFIKNLGHRIVGYILNINDIEAKAIIDGNTSPNNVQKELLEAYIQLCRQLRLRSIDQNNIDFGLFIDLPMINHNGEHIFNFWHTQMGGIRPDVPETDKVVYSLSKLALELYPLFLVKVPQDNWGFIGMDFHVTAGLYTNPNNKLAIKEILDDKSLRKMFSTINDNELETSGYILTSRGIGGGIQAAILPSTIVSNSYRLMKLRGNLSEEDLIKTISEIVEILRSVAEGETVNLPVLLGFHNISLNNSGAITTALGTIRPYSKELFELLPPESRPSTTGDNNILGFLLESTYKYKVNFRADPEKYEIPPEFEQVIKELDSLREDLSLVFSLGIEREPPVGIVPAWTILFDPLSPGLDMSWNNRTAHPMEHYLCKLEDYDSIKEWSDILRKADDQKVRIAIRRVLSALNERANPIDGFIDSIIAWENLFGGPAELKLRISMSIARLLESTELERYELQVKASKLYDDRSKIVHGDKEISYQEAAQKRDKCLNIAIQCLRKLYQSRNDLINDPDRSKKLLLE